MKILKNALFIALMLCSGFAFGQVTFSHSAGAAYYYSPSAQAPGILYAPRINILEVNDAITLSIGTHLGLGFTFSSQGGSNSFALDIPLVVELNFGEGAHPDTDSPFGGFIGAGYGISKFGSDDGFGSGSNDAAGFVFNAGIRTQIKELPLGLRGSFLLNTKEFNENVISLGIFYTLR